MGRLALATAAFAASTFRSAASSGERFKIGACEWSLRKSDPSCFQLAKEIGLDGVQVDLGNLKNGIHLRRPEMQQAYSAAAKEAGLEIASLATAEFNNIALKSEPRAAIWLHDSIQVAQALGVKVILVAQFHKGDLRGDQPGIDRTVELLRELAPRAEKAGVVFGLENYLSAANNLKIIERVGSRAVQVYYDVGNSTDMGYNIYEEIRMLKGQICELHAKDGPHMLGKGRVDFRKVREAFDAIEFSGWVQIEAAAPNDLCADYRVHSEFLRGLFSA
ncbi:MAG: sugar phosphate isomerase/epimerase family protein [Limisphaerales bacterium]